MGYLGVFLKAHQLGQEAANNVKVTMNLSTKAGQSKFRDKAYENVESYQQLGEYSYIGGELMHMKDIDAAVDKYDRAVDAGITSVMKKRMKTRGK